MSDSYQFCIPILTEYFNSVPHYFLTEDFLCVFLNRKTKKCVIHKHRPHICIDYGQKPELPCPYVDLRGKRRSPAKVKRMKRMINRKVDHDMRRIEEALEA